MIIGNAIYLGGAPLPELTNPAVAGDIRYGKQSIDGDGEVLTGTIPDYEGETDTGSVVPVDTGANGLYKKLIEGTKFNKPVYDSELTRIGSYALAGAGYESATMFGLPLIEFENVSLLRNYSFGNTCYATRIKFNSKVTTADNCFRQASRIRIVDFAAVEFIGNYNFRDSGITAVIIRSSTLCTLSATTPFNNLPTNLKFYFPPNLLIDYQSATNWTYYSSRMNPFYIAQTEADIAVLIADSTVPSGAMIICDTATNVEQRYTVKEVSE